MQAKFLSRGTNTVRAMACRRSPSVAERTQLELWHAGEVPQSRNEHSWSYDMQAKSSFPERSQLELWHAGEIPQSRNEHTLVAFLAAAPLQATYGVAHDSSTVVHASTPGRATALLGPTATQNST